MLSSPAYRAKRRGVSLMEVLFAIGVTITGLLGVIALIPVAAHYASKGLRYDHAASVGNNALSEVEVRGMLDPGNWMGWGPLPPDPRPLGSTNPLPQPISVPNVEPGRSYCIDPRFVAFHTRPDMPLPAPYTGGNWYINSRVFPYGVSEMVAPPGNLPWMFRMTLRANPRFANAMTRFQADGIFVSNDEVSFGLPDDETLSPVQELGINGQRRLSDGTLSWFATLVPKMSHSVQLRITDSSGNQHPFQEYDSNSAQDEYILSVVVVHGRDSQFPIAPDLATTSPPDLGTCPDERILDVVSGVGFDGGGGGEVTLQGLTESAVELREDDWILLGRFVPKNTSPVGRTPFFRWYRVATTDDEPTQTGAVWQRNAALIGPDWNSSISIVPGTYTSLFPGFTDPSTQRNTIAIVIRGVVTVSERTVRLETSSMWAE